MAVSTGQLVYYIFVAAWLVFAVVANIAIVVVVARDKKMRSVTNLFICSIALSDLFLAGFVLPQQLHDVSHGDASYFEPSFLCKLVNATPVFCITCSIYSMMALSIERYRSIVRQPTTTLRSRQAAFIIALVWVFSFALSTPTIYTYDVVTDPPKDNMSTAMRVCQPTQSWTFSVVNGLLILCVSYLIPQIVVYVNYGRLVFFIWKRSKLIAPGSEQTASSTGASALSTSVVTKHKVRILKMLIWAAAMFTISWIPYFVLGTIAILSGTQDSSTAQGAVFMVQLCLATFSTTYNVFLYLSFNRGFRESFLRQLCPCLARSAATYPEQTLTAGAPTLDHQGLRSTQAVRMSRVQPPSGLLHTGSADNGRM